MNCALYIHVPFCVQKCDYCDFFSSTGNGAVSDEYIDALVSEELHYASLYGIDCWKTVYMGGGTPSLLSPSQISRFFSSISKRISPSVTEEITMEMNPETVTADRLKAAHDSGVTRLSIGIQSFNDSALKAINRHCTSRNAENCLELVKKHWKGQLNLDAIAGLPVQDDLQFMESLEKIASYDPDHVSLYTLTVEEGTPLHDRIEKGQVEFDFDRADSQWLEGRDFLESKGYRQYEVSNFAKEGKESRHNMTYWRQQDYVGIGAAASGTIYGGEKLRWTNTRNIKDYVTCWNTRKDAGAPGVPLEKEILTDDILEFEFIMMGLRTLEGINSAVYRERYSHVAPWKGNLALRLGKGKGPWENFTGLGMTKEKIEKDGSTTYALNSSGILFLNRLLTELI